MTSENFEEIPNQGEKIIKKSTFNILVISLIITIGIAAFLAGTYTTNLNSDHVSQEQFKNEIAKLELKILEKQLPTKQPNVPLKISTDNDPVIGKLDAPITIIEFSDFQCPFCAKFHIDTLPSIMNEYIKNGQVKLVFRDFPIQSIHPNALPASVAAECANEQGKFKEMHDIFFERQNEWNNQETSGAMDLDDGRAYGISGTPGFFIGNDQIGFIELKGAQPFENFKKVIDSQLKN